MNKNLFLTNSFYLWLIEFKSKLKINAKKGEHIESTLTELQILLDENAEAKLFFFEGLAKSHKQAYCDWVGSAKQEETRYIRAAKAMIMLNNKQKTLKT